MFQSWLTTCCAFCYLVNGEVLDKLRESYFINGSHISDKLILAHYEGGYRGIFARDDITAGEILVKARPNAMISSKDALETFPVIYYLRAAWANNNDQHLSDNLVLSLFLLLSDMFQPTTYTRSLPTIDAYKLNFPVFWSEEMLRLMPQSFQTETRGRKRADNKLFEQLKTIWPRSWGHLKRDSFLLAHYRMNTRIAGLGISGIHIRSVLLPVFDLINHGSEKNVDLEATWLTDGELGYHVHALRDIKKGEELYVQYGRLSDLALLQQYGFTLQPSQNFSTSSPKAYLSFDEVDVAVAKISKEKSGLVKQLWPNYLNGSSEVKLTVSMEKGKVVIVDELTTIVQNVSKNVKTQMLLMSKMLTSKLKSIKHDFNHERLRASTGSYFRVLTNLP